MQQLCLFFVLCFALSGCAAHIPKEQSPLAYFPTQTERQALIDYPEEEAPIDATSRWGEELLIGKAFAQEGDWYRALTSFRKARFLLHMEKKITPALEARLAWSEALIYGFSGKWGDLIAIWEKYRDRFTISSDLLKEEWITLLYAAYLFEKRETEAEALCSFLSKEHATIRKLHEWKDLSFIQPQSSAQTVIEKKIQSHMKSPGLAKLYNGCLPGLGYWYVEQKQTACTSFLLNASFLGATLQLLKLHQPFLAFITLSFETGWYLGGITGAGLAAETYNDKVRETFALPYLLEQKALPLARIRVGW